MSKKAPLLDQAIKSALSLAELQQWDEITLHAIAEDCGQSLTTFHGQVDKARLDGGVEAYFDKAMSEGSFETDETPRTRLFDVIMMRFEAMEDARDGAMSYLRWRDRSLKGLQIRLKARPQTALWALTCAGLDAGSSLERAGWVTGLSWTIAQAERAWRKETSADLTRTMAALDAELVKLEERAAFLSRRRGQPEPDLADGEAD